MDPINRMRHIAKKACLRMQTVLADLDGWHDSRRFVKEMNRIAAKEHMKGSRFANASGATSRSATTPLDLLTLGRCAVQNCEMQKIFICREATLGISGPKRRTDSFQNIVLRDGLPIMGRFLIGGKSGSWGEDNKAHLFLCRAAGEHILFSILVKDKCCFEHIYDIALELCLTAAGEKTGGEYLRMLEEAGGGYAGWLLEKQEMVFEYNKSKKFLPASTTKVLTALLAMKLNPTLEGRVSVRKVDIIDGFAPVFFEGDELLFKDALYVMMMESSNTMANAIARTCGKMLKKKQRI